MCGVLHIQCSINTSIPQSHYKARLCNCTGLIPLFSARFDVLCHCLPNNRSILCKRGTVQQKIEVTEAIVCLSVSQVLQRYPSAVLQWKAEVPDHKCTVELC